MNFNEEIPDHHLFKGSKPEKVEKKMPFIIESNGKRIIYVAYTLKLEDREIEIWTDDNNNVWINKI